MEEMTWWRRRRPAWLRRHGLEDLHAKLVATTPADFNDALPTLLRSAAVEDGEAAFNVGLLLLEQRPTTRLMLDLTASWFLLCRHGPPVMRTRQQDAARVLRDLHLDRAAALRQPEQAAPGARMAAARHRRLAQAEADRATSLLRLYQSDLAAARRAGQSAADDADPQDDAAAETAGPAWDTPSRRVILADELPGSHGLEERRLLAPYRHLTRPVPLAGDPAALPGLADRLERLFPWLTAVTAHVRDELALRQYAGLTWLHLRPLLLVGPPGCGKTLLARKLAELAGVGLDLLSLGGASDARHVLGTARGWSSARPCGPLVAVQRHDCANPMLVLDELEKARGSDNGGRIDEALLGLIEPVSAAYYHDTALDVPCDLSAVTWIATANDAAKLPAVLRSRLTTIEVPAPDGRHLEGILAQAAHDLAADLGVRTATLPWLDPASVAALRADLDTHGDVRRVVRGYRRAAAAAVRGLARPLDA